MLTSVSSRFVGSCRATLFFSSSLSFGSARGIDFAIANFNFSLVTLTEFLDESALVLSALKLLETISLEELFLFKVGNVEDSLTFTPGIFSFALRVLKGVVVEHNSADPSGGHGL